MKRLIFTNYKENLPLENFEFKENINDDDYIKVYYRGGSEICYEVDPDNDTEEFNPCIEINDENYFITDFMKFINKDTFISVNFDGFLGTSNTGGDLLILSENCSFAYLYSI